MFSFLVTGSEGNIGPYLIAKIHQNFPDAKVIRVARNNIYGENKPGDIINRGDLNDKNFVDQIFRDNKIDYVIYASAYPYGKYGFNHPDEVLNNEKNCLKNVLSNCENVKKIVYLSSVLVYESSNLSPFTEKITEQIPPPRSPYGLAKYFGEQAVKEESSRHMVPYTIWRAHNIISPLEETKKEDGHVYTEFYKKIYLAKAKEIKIFGSGRQMRCFTWVEDLAQGIIDFLNDTRTDNQIFNIGGEESKTLIELKDELIKIGKEKKYLDADYQPIIQTGEEFYGIDDPKRLSSIKKIKDILGWRPSTSFSACFEKFVDYKQKL